MSTKSYTVRLPLVVAAEVERRAREAGAAPAATVRALVIAAINAESESVRVRRVADDLEAAIDRKLAGLLQQILEAA